MRRFIQGRRHHKPVAANPDPGTPIDNLATWTSTAFIEAMSLPGSTADSYPLVVDVTRVLNAGAIADTGGLRFRHENGVRMSHKRTAGGRIFLIGHFYGGRNKIHYHWGKVGATQPGNGYQTADEALSDYRLALIFEGNAPVDFSPSPAPWTIIGAPTYETQPLGQGMRCGDGKYIETTADKLRGNARDIRGVFGVITLPSANEEQRIICWANWNTNNRAFQIWMRTDGLELYASDNGTSFQPWRLTGYQKAGRNAVGASWKANTNEALLLLNAASEIVLPSFDASAPGPLFLSNEPYIVGGTHIPGSIFTGTVECWFESSKLFTSPNHYAVWVAAWTENDLFWGFSDRTPDSIDVPDITGAALATEVAFAKKEITGISSGTQISVLGDGNPTYSIGSSFGSPANIKAKGSSAGTISSGNWISTYHTSSALNSTVTESFVTVGSTTSVRRSITAQAVPGGGGGVPTGPADVNVSSVADLQTQFGTIQGGKILQIAQGNYVPQGTLDLSNRDFRGGDPLVIQASTLPYSGFLPSDGGLAVSGETFFTTGSGGAEFSSITLRNVHNVIIRGFRTYQGNVGTAGGNWYTLNCISCSNIIFENFKFCGYRPNYTVNVNGVDVNYALEDNWRPIYKANDPWWKQGRAVNLGVGGSCSSMTFRKGIIHYFGKVGFYNASSNNTLLEDVLFSDAREDLLKCDGPQDNFTARRCMFGRTWATKDANGAIVHTDFVQNTSNNQPGWKNHRFENCIMAPMDCAYPHIQGLFFEHDSPNTNPIGKGLFITDCLFDSRAPNTIYARPGNQTIVTRVMVVQNQFGGRSGFRDLLWNNPRISVAATTNSGKSYGNNILDRSVYHSHDFTTPGDQVLDCTQLTPTTVASSLNDFPVYSSGSWRPVMWYNPLTGVLNISEITRWSPKVDSAIHPNQKGQHYGASSLLQSLGALL